MNMEFPMKKITALLALVFATCMTAMTAAQTAPAPALSGKVMSQAEGNMEGVLIGAKKEGSTVTTWVVSNAQGEYSFPRDRVTPGKYNISIRAVGYELPRTSADVTAQGAHVDLQLGKVTRPTRVAEQMSNGEILMSVPGTQQQKQQFAGCVNCHTLQRVLFSRFDADAMAEVIQRMTQHTNNSSPMHPWFRPQEKPLGPPTGGQITLGKYL